MKKIIIASLLFLYVFPVAASGLFDQLCAFNPNWKNYAASVSASAAQDFGSDREYIRTHLTHVLTVLNNNTRSYTGTALYNKRITLLQLLNEYRLAGRFPVNDTKHQRVPVFIDRNFTHCAVAYLLQQTGHENLAMRIARDDNYAWVKDIHTDGLLQWQKESGLTVEELKLIQGAYDYYEARGYTLPNKYEIPQKPSCLTLYFETTRTWKRANPGKQPIWCRGEGVNGVLNGRWEQNYSAGIPWIIGYYNNGKRTGQWFEYYPGTTNLCRTEYWDNDKLNGTRTRFDRAGKIIEEITFKEGNAVLKINYDRADSLKWVRKPLDSTKVDTWVYTFSGKIIAYGRESVYNPGNLRWFQNIELTALNSAAISARNTVQDAGLNTVFTRRARAYSPPLVQYRKEGIWTYYSDRDSKLSKLSGKYLLEDALKIPFLHFGPAIYETLSPYTGLKPVAAYSLLKVRYANDAMLDFFGYGENDFTHLRLTYHLPVNDNQSVTLFNLARYGTFNYRKFPVKCIGAYDQYNMRAGNWLYFDDLGRLYKTEHFVIPQKDEEMQTAVTKRR